MLSNTRGKSPGTASQDSNAIIDEYHSNRVLIDEASLANPYGAPAVNHHLSHTGSKSKLQPVIAKTDFSLQQQMMGIGRCKDLDEWLVGSGESAETADSAKRGLNS